VKRNDAAMEFLLPNCPIVLTVMFPDFVSSMVIFGWIIY